MHNHGLGVVHDLPAGLPQPQAYIDILRAVEDAFVEQAHLLQGAPAYHLAGADYVIHRAHRPVVPVRHFHRLRHPSAGKGGQAPGQFVGQGGKLPARQLQLPVGVGQLRAAQPHLRLALHVTHHTVKRAGLHHRIVIQHQHVVPPGQPDTLVARRGDTAVFGVAHQAHAGPVVFDDGAACVL